MKLISIAKQPIFYEDWVLENSAVSRARSHKSVSCCPDSQGWCGYVNTSAEIGPCVAFSYREDQKAGGIELTADREFQRLGSTATHPRGKQSVSQLGWTGIPISYLQS